MWKKKILIWIISLLSFINYSIAFFEDQLSCQEENGEIQIRISKKDKETCDTTLQKLEAQMNGLYEDLKKIGEHLNNGKDISYRSLLFQKKQNDFIKVQEERKGILTKIEFFESTMFSQYRQQILPYLYRSLIHTQYQRREVKTQEISPILEHKRENLEQQIRAIKAIIGAQGREELVETITQYFILLSSEWK